MTMLNDALKTRLQLLFMKARQGTDADEAAWVDEVREAFEDEGWTQFVGVDREGRPLMTKKEWYDRFEKELHTVLVQPDADMPDRDNVWRVVRAAARRVLGLQ